MRRRQTHETVGRRVLRRRKRARPRDAVAGGWMGLEALERRLLLAAAGSAGCNHSQKISRRNSICCGTAYATIRPVSKRVDPARPHRTVAAAYSQLAEPALRFLGLQPVPRGVYSGLAGAIDHAPCGGVGGTFLHIGHHTASSR